MTPLTSRVVIASAGSGKTTWVVGDALGCQGRTAVVSYSNNNTRKIREKFAELAHAVPERVTVDTWLSFQLRELVRPYQNVFRNERIAELHLVNGVSARYAKQNTHPYFFDSQGRLYSDKLSAFALLCNTLSKGRVFNRVKALYKCIYIDEVQDLAGYDLDLLEAAMRAGVSLRMVGDNRQATYATNNSPKNRAFRGPQIVKKFLAWKKAGLCDVTSHAWSHRCNQGICNVADALFPDCEPCTSKATGTCEHAGVFLVEEGLVDRYVASYQPQVLVWSKADGHAALNFGDSKGLEFPHVLIVPTGPIGKWLRSGDPSAIESDISRAKLYVAITRARHSVAFVYDGKSALSGVRRLTSGDLT
ncbi:MAG: UvrD-helicase domain-containing protein [Labilithrix sp.]|nr:UvrD-helicase domain-containing protein [Labilithrix sp.]